MFNKPITNLSKWDQKVEATAEEEYEGFRNVLDWTEGFGLVFVECSPGQGSELIEKIKKDLSNKRVEILRFQEGEEIRNLYELVETLPNRKQIEILFIQGLEYSFIPYIKPGYGGQGNYYKLDNLPPILGHLNLQRERFRNDFDICFVFLLPFFGIKYFIQRAPDFFDWRLGLFHIDSNEIFSDKRPYRIPSDRSYQIFCHWQQSKCDSVLSEIELKLNTKLLPDDKVNLLFRQGNIFAANGEYDKAISSFDRALQIDPNHHQSWYNRGMWLFNLGQYEEAINSYNHAVRINPNNFYVWNDFGDMLLQLGKYDGAIYSYDHALKIRHNDFYVWNNRGIALLNKGLFEDAVFSFENALNIKPNQYEAWNNRGISLANLGRLISAVESYDKAISIRPNNSDLWSNRGIALFHLGRYEEAITSFDNALKITPDDHEVLCNRGVALHHLGKLKDETASLNENALKIKPDKHQAWNNWGGH